MAATRSPSPDRAARTRKPSSATTRRSDLLPASIPPTSDRRPCALARRLRSRVRDAGDLHQAAIAPGYDFMPLPLSASPSNSPPTRRARAVVRHLRPLSRSGTSCGAGYFAIITCRLRASCAVPCIAVTSPPFRALDRNMRGGGLLGLLVEIDADAARRADPSPFPHDAHVAEQTWRHRQAIEPGHVAGRVNAVEMGRGLDLHGVTFAF